MFIFDNSAIYKTFQKEEFFKRFFNELKCREDRRKFHQNREIKATIRNNSIVLSRGQTVVIAHLSTAIEGVTYSPISKNYGKQLISNLSNYTEIIVNSSNTSKNRESKVDKSVEKFVSDKIEWETIQSQLVAKDQQTGRIFAHVGEIVIRILGDDGMLDQTCLLATYFLLWTCKIQIFSVKKQAITLKGPKMLKISSFLFPSKYCEIIGQLVLDPSLSEEKSCDYEVTIVTDLLANTSQPKIIKKLKKSIENVDLQITNEIINLCKQEISKLPLDIRQIQKSVENSEECIDIVIESNCSN